MSRKKETFSFVLFFSKISFTFLFCFITHYNCNIETTKIKPKQKLLL